MSSEIFDLGMKIRREVLGDDYVDASWATANEDGFTMPLQTLATEFAWGAVWGREALDRRTRSLVTIAMLIALNRPNEIAMHVRAAIKNGCSREDIQELCINAACYCGFPAAIDASRIAREVLKQSRAEPA
jgi:4-carboxymuconolactone decarboxylase